MMMDKMKSGFREVFGHDEDGIYFAPGRVNLIGEHTDYNGGHVFPCALEIGTYGAASLREDGLVRVFSDNFKATGVIEFNMEKISYSKEDDWANYPKGMIKAIQDSGRELGFGFDIYFHGNIPHGAGLSSSASIEMLTGVIIDDLYQLNMDRLEMVRLAQKAENQFVGVNSGIMDQFAVGMGKKDHAILLDTNNLKYRYANILMKDLSIIIANTNKRRGLQDSKYNERRSQCDEALKDLNVELNLGALCELDEEGFNKYKHLIKDETILKRARHAVLENQRTIKAVEMLENNDIEGFGQLMYASHDSLRDDYEVTGKELDTLVELAREQEGVLGSRMTGAGFGGCTVTIIRNDSIDAFVEEVGEKYAERIGYPADFYVVSIGEGAGKIEG